MVRQGSKQTVYPMEHSNGDLTKAGAEGDSSRQTESVSESATQDFRPPHDESADSSDGPNADAATTTTTNSPATHRLPPMASTGGDGSNSAANSTGPSPDGLTSDEADAPWTKPRVGRRLTFADETGSPLAEISYSNRTHYSKQGAAGSLNSAGRGCCVIM